MSYTEEGCSRYIIIYTTVAACHTTTLSVYISMERLESFTRLKYIQDCVQLAICMIGLRHPKPNQNIFADTDTYCTIKRNLHTHTHREKDYGNYFLPRDALTRQEIYIVVCVFRDDSFSLSFLHIHTHTHKIRWFSDSVQLLLVSFKATQV